MIRPIVLLAEVFVSRPGRPPTIETVEVVVDLPGILNRFGLRLTRSRLGRVVARCGCCSLLRVASYPAEKKTKRKRARPVGSSSANGSPKP